MGISPQFTLKLIPPLGAYWVKQCLPLLEDLTTQGFPDIQSKLLTCLDSIMSKTSDQNVVGTFIYHYLRYLSGDTGKLKWDELQMLTPDDLAYRDRLDSTHQALGVASASSVGILKLNGGLGTTMGCTGAKSGIQIFLDKTFLDIIADQVLRLREQFSAPFPLILMNSFNTAVETKAILSPRIEYIELIQHEFPRINDETKLPFQHSSDPIQNWAPPGHGDVILSLITSGVAETLVRAGTHYLMLSNADNLGPTFDPSILGYMISQNLDFLIEATPKTAMDTKGGTLVKSEGKFCLLERNQIDEEHIPFFEDPKLCSIFNTNTLWIYLPALLSAYKQAPFHLPLIINEKTIENTKIVQLETAVGSAISHFDRSGVMVVDRNRFLPVKRTSDLLVILSDLVQSDITQNTLTFNRKFNPTSYPDIAFDEPLSKMSQFHRTFRCIPSIKDLVSLSLSGNLIIEDGVVFKGRVDIHSDSEAPTRLAQHVFENITLHITRDGVWEETPVTPH